MKICNGTVKTKVYKETINRKGMYIINYYNKNKIISIEKEV